MSISIYVIFGIKLIWIGKTAELSIMSNSPNDTSIGKLYFCNGMYQKQSMILMTKIDLYKSFLSVNNLPWTWSRLETTTITTNFLLR